MSKALTKEEPKEALENPASNLQEVLVVENKKKKEIARENRGWKLKGATGILRQVTMREALGGVGGLFAALAIPKVVRWDTGWKDVLATGVVAFGGGYLLSKGDKNAGKAFVVAGVAVLGVKLLKMAMDATGFKLFGDIGQQGKVPELFSAFGVDSTLGDMNDLVGGTLEPTYTGGA